MFNKPQDKENILEKCHNEIVEVIVKYRLEAAQIIFICEVIKQSILDQLKQRIYGIPEIKKPIQPPKDFSDRKGEMSDLPKEIKPAPPSNPSTPENKV